MHKRMGAGLQGDRDPRRSTASLRWAALTSIAATMFLLAAPSAKATFHEISIREVYPGGANNASYVELQMWAAGQNLVIGHHLVAYDSLGVPIDEFAFPADVASGANQATILVADSSYGSAFPGKPAPDAGDANLNLSPAGGAVCWTEGSPPDCVAWGNFTGPLPTHVPALKVGNPVSPAGVTASKALRRSIVKGCSTLLDPPPTDDGDDSAADFAEVEPEPRNNATAPSEKACPSLPNTTIGTKPTDPTKSTEASFSFTATPATGASFECKLDSAPDFTSCTSPKTYTGLGEGPHAFAVRAVNPAGADPTPASYTWQIDLTPPEAEILTKPPDPSPGKSVSFTYKSNELGPIAGSPFACRLVPTESSFTTCAATGKTYLSLGDGDYTFEVQATDRAGNKGGPAKYEWTVEAAAPDTTPPQTTIVSKPSNPSSSPTASFTYASDEPDSTFECMLDGGGFAACPVAGISYTDLGNGTHTFQVRAIDSSHNIDKSPAGYSFDVVQADQPSSPAGSSGAAPTSPPVPLAPLKPNLDTTISTKLGTKTHDRTPTFRFRSNQPGATFECKLDGKPFKPCRSPLTTKTLPYGRHTLLVRTVLANSTDATPAKLSFKVVRG
jgi:hypothetical protein